MSLLAGVALLLTVNAVFWTAVWLFLRWREERDARINHVCWIDDTLCRDCADYASYAEYRKVNR